MSEQNGEDAAGIGHNSSMQGTAREQLKAFINRIERLEEEKAAIAGDIREVYSEAKAMGFDPKILRQVIRIRKQDANEWAEHQAVLETYLHALGMLADTDLGRAAVDRDLRSAVEKLGTPTELTDEEKEKGYTAAFIGKDGTRMTIGLGTKV